MKDKMVKYGRLSGHSRQNRNEKGDIKKDCEQTQRIIRSYFKHLYSTKFENLREMDSFLNRYHIPNLSQHQ